MSAEKLHNALVCVVEAYGESLAEQKAAHAMEAAQLRAKVAELEAANKNAVARIVELTTEGEKLCDKLKDTELKLAHLTNAPIPIDG